MNIIDYSIKNRTVTLFLTFVIIVGGIFSYMKLGKLEDPEFRVKEAIVVTLYPGADPHQVELQVTDEIESALQQIENVEYIESVSKAGYSEVKIKLNEALKAEVIDQYWDNVRKKINDAQNQIDKMEKIKKEAKEELTPLNRVKEKLTAIQNELENTIQKKEVTNDNEETDRSLQRY